MRYTNKRKKNYSYISLNNKYPFVWKDIHLTCKLIINHRIIQVNKNVIYTQMRLLW